jgi:hypothetical protein
LAFGISSRLLSVGGRSALAFGISSRLSQLEVADALAFGISSRLLSVGGRSALGRGFSVPVKAKGSSPEEIDSSRPRLCTQKATVAATFGRHCRLFSFKFQKEK